MVNKAECESFGCPAGAAVGIEGFCVAGGGAFVAVDAVVDRRAGVRREEDTIVFDPDADGACVDVCLAIGIGGMPMETFDFAVSESRADFCSDIWLQV